MNRKRWIVLGSVLATLVIAAAVGATAAYADDATPPAPPDERGLPPEGGPRMRGLGPAGLEAAANVLGMTTEDLGAQLRAGATLEEIATEGRKLIQ